MRFPCLLALILVPAFTLAAHADTLSTFSLTDYTFQSGATAIGTIVIDTSDGEVSSEDITYFGATPLLFNDSLGTGNVAAGFYSNAPAADASGDTFGDSQHTPAVGFVGYVGGLTCSLTNTCNMFESSAVIFANNSTDSLETGSLTLVGQTPEPSSLALLGTGILGLVGMTRRKLTPLAAR